MASAFLIVRDPIVKAIYFLAWKEQLWTQSALFTAFVCIAFGIVVLGIVQMAQLSDVKPLIIIYGIRIYILHLPLAFLMPRIIGRKELLIIGRWSMELAPFMAVLMCLQFVVPPAHFLNAATTSDGEQIGSALGHIRPAATFSFSTGAVSFFLLVSAFWFYSFVDSSWVPSRTRMLAVIAIVLTLPVSGSRTYVLSFGVFLLFALIGGFANPRLLGISLRTLLGLALAGVILLQFDVFRQGIEVFTARWNEAAQGDVHVAIVVRFFTDLTGGMDDMAEIPLLGHGLGLGSNIGSMLSSGSLDFLLAENDWQRSMLEMGLLMGILWLAYRIVLTVIVSISCFKRLTEGESLGWLLLGASVLPLFNGNLVQPTSQGFIVVTLGFCFVMVGYGLPQVVPGIQVMLPQRLGGAVLRRGFAGLRRPPGR